MNRLAFFLKIYFRHIKSYAVIYVLISVSIILLTCVGGMITGMMDGAFRTFLEDQVLVGDVLVISSGNQNSMYNEYLTGMSEYYIEEAIAKSFDSSEDCSYEVYSLMNERNAEYFIYKDLMEPGTQVSIIVSDTIPEGRFSASPLSGIPDKFYLVSGQNQSYVQLEKTEDFIPYPRAFEYDMAISRSDANSLLIPARKSHVVFRFNEATEEEKASFIENINSYQDFTVLSMEDRVSTVLMYMAADLMDSYSMMSDLRSSLSFMLMGFALVSLCAMVFSVIHIHSVRSDEYALYRSLGMEPGYVKKLRLVESLITAIIPIAFSWVIVALSCVLISTIPGPDVILSPDIGLTFADVYCVDGHLFMPFPVLYMVVYSVLYSAVLLILDFIVDRGRR